jgi:hypothetical protein
VSVATGQNEFYPLYISNGNIHNNVRRAHCNGVSVLAFLSIPKSELLTKVTHLVICPYNCVSKADRRYQHDGKFRMFRRQLFHSSLAAILEPLRSAMTTPEVTRCPDGHFRRVIYGLGPYIADYVEQVLITSVVQGWCPK